MAISFKRVGPGQLRHEASGVEIKHEHRYLAAGRWKNEWVVTEPVGDQRSWVTTCDGFFKARAAAVAVIEKSAEEIGSKP